MNASSRAARRLPAQAWLLFVAIGLIGLSSLSRAGAAPVMPTSPTHGWAFDEGAGTAASPVFGTQAGQLKNGAGWSTDCPLAYEGNRSVEFFDDQDQVEFPGHYSGTAGSFQFWAYTSEIVSGDYYLHTNGGANGRMYLWATGSNAGLGIDGKGVGTFPRPPNDTWNHFVVTWDAALATNNVTVYVTNSLGQNTYSFTQTNDGGHTSTIWMGYPGWGDCGFKGRIDELAFWNVALTADNVEWLYRNSMASIPEPATFLLAALGAVGLFVLRRRLPGR